MKSRKLRKGRCLICILAAIMIFTLSGGLFEAQADNTGKELIPVYVHEGDTLWSIVEENCDYSGDIRAAIHEVKIINHMTDSGIAAGDVIYIPVLQSNR